MKGIVQSIRLSPFVSALFEAGGENARTGTIRSD